MGHWEMPLDPDCPVVMGWENNFYGDPMTDAVPGDVIGDIVDAFTKKHRSSCNRCQIYGAENVEAVYG